MNQSARLERYGTSEDTPIYGVRQPDPILSKELSILNVES